MVGAKVALALQDNKIGTAPTGHLADVAGQLQVNVMSVFFVFLKTSRSMPTANAEGMRQHQRRAST